MGNIQAKVFRQAQRSEREAWAWMVAKAATEKTTVKVGKLKAEIEQGQVAASVRTMAENWGWEPTKVHRFLNRLVDANMIVKKASRPVSVFQITNIHAIRASGSTKTTPAKTHHEAVEVKTVSRTVQQRTKRLNPRVTSTQGFLQWLKSSQPGAWCIYHEGQIGMDRSQDKDLNERAAIVMLLNDLQFINASIGRPPLADPDVFCYMATRTGTGWAPKAILTGTISANSYIALRALDQRQAAISSARAIRDTLAVSDGHAAQIIKALAQSGLITATGYKSAWELTELGRGTLT